MKILVALGGNALLQRGEPLTMESQWRNARIAAHALEPVAREHNLILTHGNGPQVGLLAMKSEAFSGAGNYTFDIMCAATGGMIGYMMEQELGNLLGYDVPIATILTRVEVDSDDPEFQDPSKFVGPEITEEDAEARNASKGWVFKRDGDKLRRVVPSPHPKRILWHRPIRWLIENNAVVICGGGGGIPVIEGPDGKMQGIEAVIDKDRLSGLLASEIPADLFVVATDVDGIYQNFRQPDQKLLDRVTPDMLATSEFSKGSMGPKVEAACAFVRKTGNPAVIGSLGKINDIVEKKSGTWVVPKLD